MQKELDSGGGGVVYAVSKSCINRGGNDVDIRKYFGKKQVGERVTPFYELFVGAIFHRAGKRREITFIFSVKRDVFNGRGGGAENAPWPFWSIFLLSHRVEKFRSCDRNRFSPGRAAGPKKFGAADDGFTKRQEFFCKIFGSFYWLFVSVFFLFPHCAEKVRACGPLTNRRFAPPMDNAIRHVSPNRSQHG